MSIVPSLTAGPPPVSAIAWALVYSYGPFKAIQLGVVMILRDYLLVGIVVATILWYVAFPVSHESRALTRLQAVFKSCPGVAAVTFYARRLLGGVGLRI
jgi:hypothetical protein